MRAKPGSTTSCGQTTTASAPKCSTAASTRRPYLQNTQDASREAVLGVRRDADEDVSADAGLLGSLRYGYRSAGRSFGGTPPDPGDCRTQIKQGYRPCPSARDLGAHEAAHAADAGAGAVQRGGDVVVGGVRGDQSTLSIHGSASAGRPEQLTDVTATPFAASALQTALPWIRCRQRLCSGQRRRCGGCKCSQSILIIT